jgi:hypothetical protein
MDDRNKMKRLSISALTLCQSPLLLQPLDQIFTQIYTVDMFIIWEMSYPKL